MMLTTEGKSAFKQRAAIALATSGAKVVRVQIRRCSTRFGFAQSVLTFCADGPCGNRLVLSLTLPDLWKSRFDRVEQNLSQNFEQHLRDDGILPQRIGP